MPMPFPLLRRHFSPLRSFSASLALVALAGCQADERSPRRPSLTAGTGAAAPVPDGAEMSAHAAFFTGQLEAEVILGHAGFGPRVHGKDGAPSDGGEARGRGGFSGSMGSSGSGGGRHRGGGGGGGDPGESRSGSPPARSGDGAPVPRIVAANRPPMRLHLRLTNHGSEPVAVEVLDFNSDLGNFVVQPRKFSLPAGASVEADPMISLVGLTADAIAVTVRLRCQDRIEQQVVMLQPVAPLTRVPSPHSPPAAG